MATKTSKKKSSTPFVSYNKTLPWEQLTCPQSTLGTGLYGFWGLIVNIMQFLSVVTYYKIMFGPPVSNVLSVPSTWSITWIHMVYSSGPTPTSANRDFGDHAIAPQRKQTPLWWPRTSKNQQGLKYYESEMKRNNSCAQHYQTWHIHRYVCYREGWKDGASV